MYRIATLLGLALPLSASLATDAAAQVPKTGKGYYEDDTDLGFKFKPPAGWVYVPPSPSEVNLVGTYKPKVLEYVTIEGGNVLHIGCWMVKFDKTQESALSKLDEGASRTELTKAAVKRHYKDFDAWIKGNPDEVGRAYTKVEEKPFKLGKLEATELLYKGESLPTTAGPGGVAIHLWALHVKIDDDRDLYLAFNAPGEKKKWKKWYTALKKIAKTYKAVEVERTAGPAVAASGSLRERKRAELEERIQRQPGWNLHETPNYFVVTSVDDKDFVEEMMVRLEAIREVYERDYPLEKALVARKAAEEREQAERDKAAGKQPGEGEKRTTAPEADPMEESRTSVVRLCRNKDEYTKYGGSPRSAGYWNWTEEELVIFDDKASGGRGNTWAVLNHEAFHQYIFYFYGNISPHSWYNEGTGDFYSGYQLNRRKKFELERFKWRERVIQEEMRGEDTAPLSKLVKMTQQEYYSDGPNGSRYPQGWSFVYFLRTGKENKAKGWNDDWGNILDVYLDTLAKTGDLEEAVDAAFAGVDWDELEASWKNYILKGD